MNNFNEHFSLKSSLCCEFDLTIFKDKILLQVGWSGLEVSYLSFHRNRNAAYAYYVYVSCRTEILRNARITSTKSDFINCCSILISRIIYERGNVNTIPMVDTMKFLVSSLQHN